LQPPVISTPCPGSSGKLSLLAHRGRDPRMVAVRHLTASSVVTWPSKLRNKLNSPPRFVAQY
jgi:hypothetical protein